MEEHDRLLREAVQQLRICADILGDDGYFRRSEDATAVADKIDAALNAKRPPPPEK